MFRRFPGKPSAGRAIFCHPERSEARAQSKAESAGQEKPKLPQDISSPLAQTLAKSLLLCLLLAWHLPSIYAQEPKRAPGSVQISFLPPPLEKATYSLGVFDAKTGKLVRQLHTAALEKDFAVGLNGLITNWDGKDDTGKLLAPGRYTAHGYALGPMKVEGEAIQNNDWAAEDEEFRPQRILSVALLPDGGGLAALATLADATTVLARFSTEGRLLWRKPVQGLSAEDRPFLHLSSNGVGVLPNPSSPDGKETRTVGYFLISDGAEIRDQTFGISEKVSALPPLPPGTVLVTPPPSAQFAPTISSPDLSVRSGVGATPTPSQPRLSPVVNSYVQRSPGKEGTAWTAADIAGLIQTAPDGTVLRKLEAKSGEPFPVAVSASAEQDQLYLLEERPGWQRVRGLSWLESKEEDGKPVSTWKTFFERSIHQPASSVVGTRDEPVEINLDENPLLPGRTQKVRLIAVFDAKGSYLATDGGLRLRQISERPNLQNVHLSKSKPPSPLEFFQYDGAATDVFSIKGLHNMMAFDAGEFELTANGEKPAVPKPTEPPDL